jgi:hypothetical protein
MHFAPLSKGGRHEEGAKPKRKSLHVRQWQRNPGLDFPLVGNHDRRKTCSKKRQVGTLDQYKTEAAAEKAVRNWRLTLSANQGGTISGVTMKAVIDHFREKELVDKGEDGRA